MILIILSNKIRIFLDFQQILLFSTLWYHVYVIICCLKINFQKNNLCILSFLKMLKKLRFNPLKIIIFVFYFYYFYLFFVYVCVHKFSAVLVAVAFIISRGYVWCFQKQTWVNTHIKRNLPWSAPPPISDV